MLFFHRSHVTAAVRNMITCNVNNYFLSRPEPKYFINDILKVKCVKLLRLLALSPGTRSIPVHYTMYLRVLFLCSCVACTFLKAFLKWHRKVRKLFCDSLIRVIPE